MTAAPARAVKLLVGCVAIAGCSTAVSEPNPAGAPGPSPTAARAFAGRITLGSSALHDDVEHFDAAWTRRLEVLGVTARITYDDDRAVIDVYGGEPGALDEIARVLLDPGAWQIELARADGQLVWWSPSRGRAYVREDRNVLCSLRARPEVVISRAGTAYRVGATLRWQGKAAGTDGPVFDVASPATATCPDPLVWPVGVVLELPAERAAATPILLAVAGGTLPAPPFLVGIEPAGGAQ